MKESFIPVPTMWNKHPLYRKLKRENPLFALFLSELIYQTAQSRDPGRLAAFDGTPLGVEELADEHGGEVEDWAAFLKFGESIEVLGKGDDGVWTILIWKTFSRDPIAEEKDRARKQLEYQQKKHEKELELVRAQLKAASEVPEASTGDQSSPTFSGSLQSSPTFSGSLQSSPEVSESLQNTPPIEVDIDLDLEKDKRSNTTARAENSIGEPKPLDRNRGAPATWDARLFKNVCRPEKILKAAERDYAKLAQSCQLAPLVLTSQMQVDLVRVLSAGKWQEYEDDPLVPLVAIKLGLNIAWSLFSAGVIERSAAWPMALRHGEQCLGAAQKIADLNRNAVELGEPIITIAEAEQRHLPSSLDHELTAAGNTS